MARNGATPTATKKLPRALDQPDSDMWLTIAPILERGVQLYLEEARSKQIDLLVRHPVAMTERFLAQCGRMLPEAGDSGDDEQESGG